MAAVTSAIQFTQGAHTAPAGIALIGDLASGAVVCQNGDDTNVVTWQWNLLSVPSDSLLIPGSLGNTAVVSFTPDAQGCYEVELVVTDGVTDTATDDRVFGIPDSRGWMIPAFGGTANAHNFAGQSRGWAGPKETAGYLLVDEVFQDISDALSHLGGDVSGDSRAVSVDKIKGTALGTLTGANVSDALTWNGSAWVPVPSGGSTSDQVIDVLPILFGAPVAGTPIYMDAGGAAQLSDASGIPATQEVYGLILAVAGGSAQVVTSGVCPYAPGGLTPGAPVYLAPGGGLSMTAPPNAPAGVRVTRIGTVRADGVSISVDIQIIGET